MSRFAKVLPFVLLGLLFVGCTPGPDATSPSASSNSSPAEYLYVQEADTASISADGGEFFVLELSGVDENTVYFADRPRKDAGSLSTELFVSSFSWSPVAPNAALVIRGDGDEAEEVTIAISVDEPQYDSGAATLRYRVQPLDSVAGTGLASFEHDVGEFNTRVSTDVSLFIDDGTIGECDELDVAGVSNITRPDGSTISAALIVGGIPVMDGESGTSKLVGTEDDLDAPGAVRLTFANGSETVIGEATCVVTPQGLQRADELEPGSSVRARGGTTVLEATTSVNTSTDLVRVTLTSANPVSTMYVDEILVGFISG